MSTLKNEIANKKRGVGVVAEKERLEDEQIRKCLQEAYGYSDAQLLKEMEAAEKSLSEDEFSGVEKRMFQKIMEMEAAEQATAKNAAKTATESAMENVTALKVPKETAVSRITASNASAEKKAVRFRKKKVLLAAGLVALFVGMLGVTAIGEKSYFFKRRNKSEYSMVLNNDQNIADISGLEEAYEKVEDELGVEILKMSYIPQTFRFVDLAIVENYFIFIFNYDGNKIYYIVQQQDASFSMNANSDRDEEETVYNGWLKKDITIYHNSLKEGNIEYSAIINIDKLAYRLIGVMEKEEFEYIVKNLYYF